jgi:hypothetical protein
MAGTDIARFRDNAPLPPNDGESNGICDYRALYPLIDVKKDALPDADDWAKVKEKLQYLER